MKFPLSAFLTCLFVCGIYCNASTSAVLDATNFYNTLLRVTQPELETINPENGGLFDGSVQISDGTSVLNYDTKSVKVFTPLAVMSSPELITIDNGFSIIVVFGYSLLQTEVALEVIEDDDITDGTTVIQVNDMKFTTTWNFIKSTCNDKYDTASVTFGSYNLGNATLDINISHYESQIRPLLKTKYEEDTPNILRLAYDALYERSTYINPQAFIK